MNNILLCVSAGRGPAECRHAASLAVAAMKREAEELGLVVAVEDGAGQRASILLTVAGDGALVFASSWEGTIQWTARSASRPGHKRKNWFVAVRRLPEPPVSPVVAASDLRFETLRAGGPGGQHQNRTESAVRVVHVPTGLSVVTRDERSQHRNKALAVERLRILLGAIHDRDQNAARFRDWLAKIAVERGNPARTYAGPDFIRQH